jgi:hypothetical protein
VLKAARSNPRWTATSECVTGVPRFSRDAVSTFIATSTAITTTMGTTGSATPSHSAMPTAVAWPAIATLRRYSNWRRLAASAGTSANRADAARHVRAFGGLSCRLAAACDGAAGVEWASMDGSRRDGTAAPGR